MRTRLCQCQTMGHHFLARCLLGTSLTVSHAVAVTVEFVPSSAESFDHSSRSLRSVLFTGCLANQAVGVFVNEVSCSGG